MNNHPKCKKCNKYLTSFHKDRKWEVIHCSDGSHAYQMKDSFFRKVMKLIYGIQRY